jgi:hypothetical protein
VIPFFVEGQPYAFVMSDCASIVAAFAPEVLVDKIYLRVFLQYENSSSESFLLEPLNDLTLNCRRESDTFSGLKPVSPTVIEARFDNQKTIDILALSFSGAVESAIAHPTRVRGAKETWTVEDTDAKRREIADRTRRVVNAVDTSARASKSSVLDMVLKRHTLFPESTYSGFAYFEVPFVAGGRGSPESKLADCVYDLQIQTPCGQQTVRFRATPGE